MSNLSEQTTTTLQQTVIEMEQEKPLRLLLSQLALLLPVEKFEKPAEVTSFESIVEPIAYILNGESSRLLVHEDYAKILFNDNAVKILDKFPSEDLSSVLVQYVDELVKSFGEKFLSPSLTKLHLHIIAISLLQSFIQANFTGPGLEFTTRDKFFPQIDEKLLQLESIRLLNLEGQTAYDLTNDPLFLILASILFERLTEIDVKHSLINRNNDITIEEMTSVTAKFTDSHQGDCIKASIQWWRARTLQVHLSVLSEPANVLSSVSSLLLNPSVVNALTPSTDDVPELQKNVQLVFFMELARGAMQAQTEHLATPFLIKASEISQLEFVLTGAKAKRTKFQTFFASALIVLARSKGSSIFDAENTSENNLESFNLDSDLLLEKPQFESLDDLEIEDRENPHKKLKIDVGELNYEESNEEKLIPTALKQEDVPADLKALDPNDQPALNDLDNIQLLLRLALLKQISPSGNLLVEEELMAIVSRVLYTNSKSINWSVFGRALWERSMLETHKSRTIERGILQMTSLVEEVGIKIKTKMIPQGAENEESKKTSAAAARLRFIHILPLMPQWAMDAKLAEQYMSIGILRSAIDIYERLNMVCEAALCYAAVDNEAEAERILVERVKAVPQDARAISILGDIKQDPAYWNKAWEIGRYAKAKASLARYYYNPPANSGLTKDLGLTLENMNECLTANPLSYENWFFYGCCGLESQKYELASEAFTRCVALDDTNSHAWSNLATALLRTDKIRPAFNALKKAIRSAGEGKKSWRIYENYLIVAAKLNEWNDVLLASRELLELKAKKEGEVAIDIPVLEKLTEILVATKYPDVEAGERLTHYQSSCTDLICNLLPNVINTSARCWRIVSRVEVWRRRPWAALECHEKAYRAVSQRAELETEEEVWNDAVEACADLLAAYESWGELPGKHGAGDLVCKDWKYKSRTTIRSLMSKGKSMWEDSEGWNKLQELKEGLSN